MTNDTQNLFDSLDSLLAKERAAIMEGRLEELDALLPEKERLVARLSALDAAETAALSGLKAKAERNHDLMESAMKGIRSVAERLGTLKRLRRSLETYDRTGNRTVVTRSGGQMEKRA